MGVEIIMSKEMIQLADLMESHRREVESLNLELDDLRAYKALAIELANRKGFDSVAAALDSINYAEWVEVGDALPDKNKPVLVNYSTPLKHSVQSVAIHFDGLHWRQLVGGHKFDDGQVTHWMNLPESPATQEGL